MSVLAGVKVLEIEGIGPGPFCGMLLADLGADVVLLQRSRPSDPFTDVGDAAIDHRGKPSIAVDLISPQGGQVALQLAAQADCLNYLGMSGVLWYASPAGSLPYTPPTVVGDVAGGALYLAIGLLAGLLNARATCPEECCGIIVARNGCEEVTRVTNVQNAMHAHDPQQFPRQATTAYTMGPEAVPVLIAADRGRLVLRAFYHSHRCRVAEHGGEV